MIPWFPAGYGLCRYKFTEASSGKIMGCSMGHLIPAGEEQLRVEALSHNFELNIIQGGARLSDTWTYLGTSLEVNTTAEANELFEYAADQAGQHLSDSLPPNCALLVAKRTGLIGRAYRGRLFVPAGVLLDVEVTNAGTIIPAVMNGLIAQFQSWFDDCATDGHPMQLFHQYDPVLSQTPVAPTPLTSLAPQALIATQRRRLR